MAAPGPVRAVVTDVDETILPAGRELSSATIRAMQALDEAGIAIIVATGRVPPINRIEVVHRHLALAVCSTGSIGYRHRTHEQLWRCEVPASVIDAVGRVVAEQLPGAGIALRDGATWIMTADYLSIRATPPPSTFRLVEPSELAGFHGQSLSIRHPVLTAEQLRAVLLEAGLGDQVTLSVAGPQLLDLTPAGVDKASGLGRALELLQIPAEQTIAFGDAPNDLPMFDVVGHSIAMGNAFDEVKGAADVVTEACDNDGFARQLIRLGLIERV